MVYNWIKYIHRSLANHCLLCGDDCRGNGDIGLCVDCHSTLPYNRYGCEQCALPLAENTTGRCGRCQKDPPAFDLVIAPLRYEFPVAELVLQLKYRHRLAAGRVLGQLLAEAVVAKGTLLPDVVIPVPLHPTRLRERGFNQTVELAGTLGRELRLPILHDALLRVAPTRSQAALRRSQRLRNLGGAFACGDYPLPRYVALVDDVVTTGATAEAIARVLRQAGVEQIEVWAAARTPWESG